MMIIEVDDSQLIDLSAAAPIGRKDSFSKPDRAVLTVTLADLSIGATTAELRANRRLIDLHC